ncbi:MAG: hypothetical protein JHD26_14115, partial [Gemmataceae bacterium]|nr:hypothetical protein [Gemmataceae bacterium]
GEIGLVEGVLIDVGVPIGCAPPAGVPVGICDIANWEVSAVKVKTSIK